MSSCGCGVCKGRKRWSGPQHNVASTSVLLPPNSDRVAVILGVTVDGSSPDSFAVVRVFAGTNLFGKLIGVCNWHSGSVTLRVEDIGTDLLGNLYIVGSDPAGEAIDEIAVEIYLREEESYQR